MDERPTFLDDHHLRLNGFDFHFGFPLGDIPDGALPVEKSRELVESYVTVIDEVRPSRIVELGIRLGGSTALLSELARPEKLVSFEIAPVPPPALTQYLDRSGQRGPVRPYFGVDQADGPRLTEILMEEFEGALLDLVIDDASHYYEQTRASFETLFPHLRPGGLFIIEDWRWEHIQTDDIVAALRNDPGERRAEVEQALGDAMVSEAKTRHHPLTRLVIALVVARASSGEAVEEITIGDHWVVVRRGPGALEPGRFQVSDLFEDHFNLL